jgi:metal iron transporter
LKALDGKGEKDKMNCPSRTDEPEGTGFNQNPNALAADLTTRQDLNGRANSRLLRRIVSSEIQNVVEDESADTRERNANGNEKREAGVVESIVIRSVGSHVGSPRETLGVSGGDGGNGRGGSCLKHYLTSAFDVVKKFGKFIGPGFMVSIYLVC